MGLVKQTNTGSVQLLQGATGCCPDTADAICKHVFEITDLASITSITIDGNVHLIAAPDETNVGDILTAIEEAFIAEGYRSTNDKEMIPDIKVWINDWLDSQTVITIYTNAESVSMVTVPVVTNTEIKCVKTVSCRYNFRLPVGEVVSVEISDSDVEDANPADSPQTISGTWATGEEALVAAELDTEFGELYASEVNATLKRVRVRENVVAGYFDCDVWLYGRHPNLTTDDEEIVIEQCECEVDHTIAN